MKVSVVIAKIAGTLSTAKIRSAMLMTTSARKSGVAHTTILPVTASGLRTKNFSACRSCVTRIRLVRNFTTGFFEMSGSLSGTISILMPVAMRKAPKM